MSICTQYGSLVGVRAGSEFYGVTIHSVRKNVQEGQAEFYVESFESANSVKDPIYLLFTGPAEEHNLIGHVRLLVKQTDADCIRHTDTDFNRINEKEVETVKRKLQNITNIPTAAQPQIKTAKSTTPKNNPLTNPSNQQNKVFSTYD